MSDHTPGPWHAEGDGDWFDAVDERGFAVAEAMTEPDARLIAAAPDLLAALRTCPCPADGWNTIQDCVTAGTCGCDCGKAIAKAEKINAA